MEEAFESDWIRASSLAIQLKPTSRVKTKVAPLASYTFESQLMSRIELAMRSLVWLTRWKDVKGQTSAKDRERPTEAYMPSYVMDYLKSIEEPEEGEWETYSKEELDRQLALPRRSASESEALTAMAAQASVDEMIASITEEQEE